MSQSYYLYTEALVNGKWVLINGLVRQISNESNNPVADTDKFEKENLILASTYTSHSRSYFGSTYDKLREIGNSVSFNDLSNDLKSALDKDDYFEYLIIDYNKFLSYVPDSKQREYHGIVHKDTIAKYEAGEVEDIYEDISIEKYENMSDELKKCYQYYEWDDSMGWFSYFREIRDIIGYQWETFETANWLYDTPRNLRIVACTC